MATIEKISVPCGRDDVVMIAVKRDPHDTVRMSVPEDFFITQRAERMDVINVCLPVSLLELANASINALMEQWPGHRPDGKQIERKGGDRIEKDLELEKACDGKPGKQEP